MDVQEIRTGWLTVILVAGMCCGCMDQSSSQTASNDESQGSSPASAGGGPAGMPQAPTTERAADAPATPAQAPSPPAIEPFGNSTPQRAVLPPALQPAPPSQGVPAGVGVGAKGRRLDNRSGVLVTPLKTLLGFREKVVFEMRIPDAMRRFEATESRKPKSHEEFMSRIIKANGIQLPKLPGGHEYYYDPERGELVAIKKGN